MSIKVFGGIKSTLPIKPADQCNEYKKCIIIDAYAPLLSQGYPDRYYAGGVTVALVPIYPINGYISETILSIARMSDYIDNDDTLIPIYNKNDILKAKQDKKLGTILMLHSGSSPLQKELSMLKVYYKLGVRQMMLCYDGRSLIGDSYTEKNDSGLSIFGERVIKIMNDLGMIIDLARTGERTSLDVINKSTKPVIYSHGGCYALNGIERNIKDRVMREIAKNGGLIGIAGFPPFLSDKLYPTIDDYIRHIDYAANLIGIDHVCIGMDYYNMQSGIMAENEAKILYKQKVEENTWNKKTHDKPPYYFPNEINLPERLPNLYTILRKYGFNDDNINKIMGENYYKLFEKIVG